MKKVAILKGTVGDFEIFYELFTQSLRELFPYYTPKSLAYLIEVDYPEEWIKQRLIDGKKTLIKAEEGSLLVGYFLVSKTSAGVAFGDWIAVRKEYQHQGIATKLLKKWEEVALAQGAHALSLWTTKNNVKFYQNRGFILVGEFPQSWYGIDHFLFYKSLQEPKESNYLRDYLASKQ